jgi:hypothetical protein
MEFETVGRISDHECVTSGAIVGHTIVFLYRIERYDIGDPLGIVQDWFGKAAESTLLICGANSGIASDSHVPINCHNVV